MKIDKEKKKEEERRRRICRRGEGVQIEEVGEGEWS